MAGMDRQQLGFLSLQRRYHLSPRDAVHCLVREADSRLKQIAETLPDLQPCKHHQSNKIPVRKNLCPATHLLLQQLLHLALEDKARRQRVLVLAFISVGALPEPASASQEVCQGTYRTSTRSSFQALDVLLALL
eukprot:scaffold100163_cov15-Tisochrysis_lutea.AAC.1